MSGDAFRPSRSALHALAILAALQGRGLDRERLFQELDPHAAPADLLTGLRRCDLKARWIERPWNALPSLPLPVLIRHRDGSYAVLARFSEEGVVVYPPEQTQPELIDRDAYQRDYSGHLLLVRWPRSAGGAPRHGLAWLWPAVARHRGVYRDVLLATVALQGLALATPLAFQAVIDKVLGHHALTTLDLVGVALLCAALFEALLGLLRGYLLAHTGCRVDAVLSAGLHRRLLSLPLGYFGSRPTGDSVARLHELGSVRSLLTGAALAALTELPFVVLFLALLFLYSPVLGAVAAAAVPLYALSALLLTPRLRQLLEQRLRRSADSHAFLVETVDSIETVKSFGMEHRTQRRWEELCARTLQSTYRAARLQVLGSQCAQLWSRLTTVVLLWLGARLVMSGELSVGQLVACNMLAARVSAPLQRVGQIWQDLQQALASLRRVDDILQAPPEPRPAPGAVAPEPLLGAIRFESVRFSYRPAQAPVLEGLTFAIAAGELVAVVGRSGAGKSTLARLLLALHRPQAGRIRLDGFDLHQLDPLWLRRRLGWVQQEAPLLNATVRDNIAGPASSLSADTVLQAAQLAGAHDFILDLADGYDTVVGEHGAGLSGGQRQRLALARALARNPRILLLDEVSSALDAEAEQGLRQRLERIRQGRTVLMICHRLDFARLADRVLVLAGGRVAEQGPPEQLLASGGEYARLLALQQGAQQPPLAAVNSR